MQNQHRRKVTFALAIATFLAAIEGTIISTASASIANDLQGVSLVSWIFAAYLLTMSVSIPIYGKLADLYGRRFIFTFGAIVFLVGSMLCGMAQSMEQLVWFRALQGLGAGAVMPTTTTIVGDIYPYEQRAKIQGLFSAIWGISGLVAPLLGGLLVDYVSWHWIFYINLPFGIVSIILLRLNLKETVKLAKKKQIDYLGAATFTVAVTSLLFAILLGGTHLPWGSLSVLGLFIGAILFFVLFLYVESKVPEPMLPLRLFRIRSVSCANISGFLLSTILIGINIYVPIWIQGIYGYGATGAGLSLIPMSIAWTIGANYVGVILPKLGPKKTILIGFSFLLIGISGLAFMSISTPPWALVGIMLVSGFGFGTSMTVIIVLGQSGMQNEMRGVASGVNNFLRTLGQTVGAAIYGALFNHLLSKEVTYTAGDVEKILSPESSSQLSQNLLLSLRDFLFSSLHILFFCMCICVFCVILIGFIFPNQPPVEEKN